MTSAEFDRMRRWGATATTWMKKTCALYAAAHESTTPTERGANLRAVIGYDAAEFLRTTLYESTVLVKLIDADSIEEVEEHAKKLTSALRAHRLSIKLASVEGRTPEEAATFKAKAAELAR